ncbi:hypothetical protein PHIN8_03090 [Polynucleobacter sp. HIN8]|uniref:hypothetical protein n=1 Tax=Polynucleobacter sp. HIN8 TaxID=3047867 RepID=UPI00257319EE|nr:hypothetical protein [Polynucleobacter sp. HIN8]BEI38365.1 hypothetical protein PHIN8_03090 [Polynucleobacter sp. HIN8]
MNFLIDIIKPEIKNILGLSILIRLLLKDIGKFWKTKVWFIDGSVVDIFAVCGLLASLKKKHHILISEDYKSTICRYNLNTIYNVIYINSLTLAKYRKYYYWLKARTGNTGILKFFQNTHCINDKTLYFFIKNNKLGYRESLAQYLGMPMSAMYKHPQYSNTDYELIQNLFDSKINELNKIALIGPIAYTHGSFKSEIWEGVSDALKRLGFKCILNTAKKSGDYSQNMHTHIKNVNLPVDLVPLASSLVGLCIGGTGGGFDLMHQFSDHSKTILMHCNTCFKNGMQDYPLEMLDDLYLNDCGRKPSLIISITGKENTNEISKFVYNKISEFLNKYQI